MCDFKDQWKEELSHNIEQLYLVPVILAHGNNDESTTVQRIVDYIRAYKPKG